MIGVSAVTTLTACDNADKAAAKAKEVGEQAGNKGKEIASDLGDKAKGKADELWAKRPETGELSDAAKGIFDKGAEVSGDGVEAMLAKGQQMAPAAFDVAKSLDAILDTDTHIEPIVQNLDDDDAQAELDARIKDMPRVETIDGVDVGFKDVTQWDSAGRETEAAYLVLWRREKRLLGLVYRSHHRINLDKLVEETPKLIALASGAL